MTVVVLAYPWTGPDGVAHNPETTVRVDEQTAKSLIADGKARPAPKTAAPSKTKEK